MKTTTPIIMIIFYIVVVVACADNDNTAKNPIIETENEGITITSNWYDVDYLKDKTYIIKEPKSSQTNVSYLLIGDNKAIMYDTGSGENEPENGTKIKHITDQLTNLPVSLLLSHFHFDHNQNISEFENIVFPDLPFLKERITGDNIFSFTTGDLFIGEHPSQVQVNEWLPVNEDIDLGNRIIQLVNIPGHTIESTAIIDKTNKIAFLGDYLYNGALFLFNNNDLNVYRESIDHLISILDSDYTLYGAHGAPKIAFNKLQTLKDFLICIENNNCQSSTATLWGYNVKRYNYSGMEIIIFQL
ncbi:MBL fold metallo-hydrolase [Aquimarina megaterium]|uniref:MBL fold metallo-hydrolase n=1 Tax=Aquimarina megaterium TaxID=1443666 RepID=UPI00046F2050|nr:MBL fold metallo-hydrolase [Aquimarina megaterium]